MPIALFGVSKCQEAEGDMKNQEEEKQKSKETEEDKMPKYEKH